MELNEQSSSSWNPPTYEPPPSLSGDDPWQSSEEEYESDSDLDPTRETTVAAPYMGLDPFETADQEDCLEVRAEASLNSRVEELYENICRSC